MAIPIALTIRAKKLGVLLRDARQAAGKTMKECSETIDVSSRRIGAFERGESAPSLPELEGLAYFLGVPIEHFWGDDSMRHKGDDFSNVATMIGLRQRIIGAKLRMERQAADISMTSLAEDIGVSATILRSYERGDRPIPLPELEIMLQKLALSLDDFRDQTGPAGLWALQQESVQQFLELSPELQAFIAKPVNMPYLELAMRLSQMSVDRLRAVAEGLLDITL